MYRGLAVAAVATAVPGGIAVSSAGAQSGSAPAPGQGPGSFGVPFVEPTVGPGAGYPRVNTGNDPNRIDEQRCVKREGSRKPNQGQGLPNLPLTPGGQVNPNAPVQEPGGNPIEGNDRFIDCKPAGGAVNVLPGGKTLYWDNLAGTENVEFSIASEYGVTGLNDQSRVLDVKRRQWQDPDPIDGGAKTNRPPEPTSPFASNEDNNDASMFCADHNFFFDGTLMATGGTMYRNEPGNDQSKYGSTELNGAENTRRFDPKTNRWVQLSSMNKGRWYSTAVTLEDGRQFVASGLRKLIKPVNRTALQDAITSGQPLEQGRGGPLDEGTGLYVQEGQNERTSEILGPKNTKANPLRTNPKDWTWKLTGNKGRRSLPLFSRLHLLPNGNVFFNVGGQSFNPEGQAFDEATWNIAATFNPDTKDWSDLGVPGLEAATSRRAKKAQAPDVAPGNTGFRGSTFSVKMPLKPDAQGRYRSASFLVGGGVVNPPSPGSYFAVRDSRITTVTTSGPGGKTEKMSTRNTGPMIASSNPFLGRWYGQGTLLPTGQVLATSGADRDEVASPGSEIAHPTAEIYEPSTNGWRPVAKAKRLRTYHNTATLLPDARVLVGGHAIISNTYLRNQTVPGGVTAPNGEGRDPSFEIFRPPYLDCGKQGRVTSVKPVGSRLEVTTDGPARDIASVVVVRNTSTTHLVDADQNTVQLRVLARRGNKVTVAQAPNGRVAPPGPYMVFANRREGGCLIPSVSRQVSVAANGKVAARAAQRRRQPRFTG